MKLIDIVEKTHNNPVGTFANIYDDLADVTKKHKLTPMLKMAHAYAKRAAAAGLFCQGAITHEDFIDIYQHFKITMIQTDISQKFQDDACAQAIELLLSYDQRLKLQKVIALVMETHAMCDGGMSYYDPELGPIDYEAIFNPLAAFPEEL